VSQSAEREALRERMNVSRETMEALDHYVALLTKWTAHINLVSPSTVGAIWSRHIADCAQLLEYQRPGETTWADLGSGAGLPGLIVAIMSERRTRVEMIESDTRKCVFLRTCARELGLNVSVHEGRIEGIPPLNADLVSARALAPIRKLVPMILRHQRLGGRSLLLKGTMAQNELDEAAQLWDFEYKLHPSRTQAGAAIVEIGTIHGKR
jgi:16S rRNA (guanine527-N7)-methyltransferase